MILKCVLNCFELNYGYAYPVFMWLLERMGTPTLVCVRSCPKLSGPAGRLFSVMLLLAFVCSWFGALVMPFIEMCVVRFGKKEKLAPRFVGPFEIIEKVGPVAYRLYLPKELNGVHDTFHMSNLKKCLAEPTLQVPLDEIRVDAKEFKKLKRRRIAIVKVRWNSKRGPEFTWEHEDQMKLKYPYFLVILVAEFWEGANEGALDFSTIIAQQLQKLLPAMLAQVGNQRNVGNQNGNVVNENVQENIGNVLVNGNRVGCSYKEFLACNPKEHDSKGGVVVLTQWIKKMENMQDMSGCSVDQ
uniref:Putative reverse transcriptase domain-containing protein n=1 Tax=Tanacetum cinerariifolium TaxID=118510 RepID=A0A6L2P6B1_TANCI|nr:putative reverse transcriptase domain-containing protein [Tanacetum cinerariifolium]